MRLQAKRVCLEPISPEQGIGCCIKDGRLFENRICCGSQAKRLAELTKMRRELDFRRRLSGVVCKPPYAASGGNSRGGER